MNETERMRTALVLTMLGLAIEVFCLWDVTPATFLAFATVSVPLILSGLGMFVHTVWRVLRKTEGL